jgi:hypothetical protein
VIDVMEINKMETVLMSKKEINKAMVVGLAIEKKITQKEAASRLDLSVRQVKRLVKKIRLYGPEAIVHKSRGKTKKSKYCEKLQDNVFTLLQCKYLGFGPTFAVEKFK